MNDGGAIAPGLRRGLLERHLRREPWFWLWRRPTASLRALPGALIIGAQKCGTTSLYDWLVRHPRVSGSWRKEAHFFDAGWHLGEAWYRAHFGLRATLAARDALALEGSPYYLFHPHAPARARALVPDARLIVLVREPAARALSQYHHNVRHDREPLSFAEAIAQEEARIGPDRAELARDPLAHGAALSLYSYFSRGLYLEQLLRWEACFPRERILVLRAEDLFAEPAATLHRAQAFLGLEPHTPRALPTKGSFGYSRDAEAETLALLRARYRAPNAALAAHLGVDLGWDA